MLLKLVILFVFWEIIVPINGSDCTSQTIQMIGAGSSFPSAMYQELGAIYSANRSLDRNINFFFDKVNSVYGKERLKMSNASLAPIVFAGVEVPMNADEKAKFPGMLSFPTAAGALAIVYNIPKTTQINLTSTSIADIFMGKIEYWNNIAIQSVNPNFQMPYKKILVVARSDTGAGDTFIFTSALSKISQIWNKSYGTFTDPEFVDGNCCNSTKWPSNITFYGNRVTGLIGIVASIPYTLGYAAWPNTLGTGVTYAKIINSFGALVEPNVDTVRSAMDYYFLLNASQKSDGLEYDISGAKSENAYPFASFSYIIVNRTTHANITSCQMQELCGFVSWLFNPTNLDVITKYGLVPLSSKVTDFIIKSVLPLITYEGVSSYNEFLSSLIRPSTISKWYRNMIIIGIVFAVVMTLVALLFWMYYRKNKLINDSLWMLNGIKIVNEQTAKITSSIALSVGTSVSTEFARNYNSAKSTLLDGYYEKIESSVLLTQIDKSIKIGHNWNKKTKMTFNKLMKEIQHINLMSFLGVTVIETRTYFVNQYSFIKGTLHHVLDTCPFQISESIKTNISCDTLEGLRYLHQKNIVHGMLNSLECLVDVVWSVKLCHWELNAVNSTENFFSMTNLLLKAKSDETVLESHEELIKLLYLDPDYLLNQGKPTYHSDIYSYGVLLTEIYSRKLPYCQEVELGLNSYPDIIREKFVSNYFAPPMSIGEVPTMVQNLVYKALTVPARQIDMGTLHKTMKQIAGNKKSVVDILMQSMETYMSQLEDKVNERTAELSNVTDRMRELLSDVLPKQLATKLFRGQAVEPEFYECCTIFFSDIVEFTNISAMSKPTQVMTFLNALYILFDKTIEKFDAYKVDTIGDAYMVASGLPVRNGIDHCKHIAMLALELMAKGNEFKIPHLPSERLKLRMGINSGPVTTGIIGNKMPRFCVLGDTVSVALRMESTCLPFKIQISETSKNLLVDYFPQFSLELRGEIEIKGKEKMHTYWLHSYEQRNKNVKVSEIKVHDVRFNNRNTST